MTIALTTTPLHHTSNHAAEDALQAQSSYDKTLITSTIALGVLGATVLSTAASAAGVAALSTAALIGHPHYLPKALLYRVAVVDLIIRSTLNLQQWWSEITPELLLGGIPLSNYSHHKDIKALGVTAVHALLEDWEAIYETAISSPVLEDQWQEINVEYRRVAIADMEAIPLEELQASVEWLHQRISLGKKVYVHCKAGRGRSAMVVISYLICHKHMGLDEALLHVTRARPTVRFRPVQTARLEEYFQSLKVDPLPKTELAAALPDSL